MIQAVLGSPDAYGKQIDGMGGATSSTSKVAIISPSEQAGCQVDYLFGHIAVVEGTLDYSGNCGNLTAAAIKGTLVHNLVRKHPDHCVLIGYGAGIMDMQADVSCKVGQWQVEAVTMGRTARRLMEGAVCIPSSVW